MRIYLIRHAHAVGENHELDDASRFLSGDGRRTIRAVARAMRDASVNLDVILTSPLVRAVQTAEILADGLDFVGVIEATPFLRPGSHPRLIGQSLPTRGTEVAVVSHEPTVSHLAAFLVGQPGFPAFRPAQVSVIEDGKPLWWIHPDTLQRDRLLLS